MCCCDFGLHFVVLLFCCSLAGTKEAKQVLQAKLPNCNICICYEDEDEDEDEDQDDDQDED